MLVSVMYRWRDFIACVMCRTTPVIRRYLFVGRCFRTSLYVCDVVITIDEPTESEIVSVVTMYWISNV
jgi:hypothetical protein